MGDPSAGDVRHTLGRLGPVGRDLLAVDWDKTPLGPPERWPRSLGTIVTALVASRFSMWMAWGPELSFFCNEAYRRDTLGVKYPWALGRPASEVWEEIWPDIGPRIRRVLDAGEATWDEALLLFLERSGYAEETYHTFSYSPLRDDDGAVAGMLCVVTEDTSRVIAQRRIDMLHRLASVGAQLMDEAAVLDAVALHLGSDQRSLPFTIGYLYDGDGQSARLAWATGLDPGHVAAPLTLSSRESGPWPVAKLAAGEAVTVPLVPAHGELPSGAWAEPPTTARVVPLVAPGGGRPYGFLVAALNRYRPIDDGTMSFVELVASQVASAIASARAYEAERGRAEELAALDAAKTAFFTNVSHELRTPLTLILGPVDDALGDTDEPLGQRQRERAEMMARNAHRLLALVNTLLDFSRLQSGRSTARFEPADLAQETVDLVSMFASAYERAGLKLTVDAVTLPQPVYVDREMWAKVVLNLLSNALKFTFEGGVDVVLGIDGDAAQLMVTDTGVGIAPEDQVHLFERFHRVSGAPSRTHEGSGIGLALVAELVAVHGGTVAVDSAVGEGSTFTVRVPFGAAHLPPEQVVEVGGGAVAGASTAARAIVDSAWQWLAGDEDTEASAARPDGLPSDAHVPRVLVVDDNADMRRYVTRLLSTAYAVESAVDGVDGLAKARSNPPDLVLTDIMMPNLDGFGLLNALRADPITAAVPVVFVSARAGEEGIVEGLDAGADDYLAKPFSAPELFARVRANLEFDRSRRARAALERSRVLLDRAQQLAQVGSWELDVATGTMVASDNLLALLGLSRLESEALGLEGGIATMAHPDDRAGVAAALERAVTDGLPFEYEVRITRRDGEQLLAHVVGEVLTGDDGAPAVVRGSMQDITSQREAERQLAAAAAAQELAAQEQRIADELQIALLPAHDIEPDHLEVATYYRPGTYGTRVGGDWYDVIELGAGRTAIVLGDVMGRGVRAAAVMGQVRSAVRAYARLDLSPAELLEYLDAVVRDLDADQMATCVYAVHDTAEGTLTWASAGHFAPLLAPVDGHGGPLDGAIGPPLGAGPITVPEHRVALPPGALLALYSDGLVERRGDDLEAGIGRLAGLLGEVSGHLQGAPEALAAALLPEGADDDVAVLLARVPNAAGPGASLTVRIEPRAEAVAGAREGVASVLSAWQVPTELAEDVVLVVSELITNAVIYGQPPIELSVRVTGPELVVDVRDRAMSGPRRLRPTFDDEHGRGLVLVSGLATRWGSRAVRNGKSVWCTFSLSGTSFELEARPALA